MGNDLQETAENIIEKLDLQKILGEFGEVHLVGNVALKTTVKPDIDFQIYTDEDVFEVAQNIQNILDELGVKDTAARELKLSHGKALATGFFEQDGLSWAVDVSVTTPSDDYILDGYRFYRQYFPLLNFENTETINKLKKHFLKRDMLWNGMSYYIYRAVLEEGATTVSDIFEYLKNNKINISRFKKGKNDKSRTV